MPAFLFQKASQGGIMRVDGNGVFLQDKIVLGAGIGIGNPAAADTLDFLVPAGFELTGLTSINDDMDTGAALLYRVGYRPVRPSLGPVAVDNYFALTGQTAFRAPGRVEYTFKPIKFEQDVFISVLIETAAVGISGNPELFFIAEGNQVGVR